MLKSRKVEILTAEKEIIEAKTEMTVAKKKWDEKLIHAWSMFAIKVMTMILVIVMAVILLTR